MVITVSGPDRFWHSKSKKSDSCFSDARLFWSTDYDCRNTEFPRRKMLTVILVTAEADLGEGRMKQIALLSACETVFI